jgi:hypothetical protein
MEGDHIAVNRRRDGPATPPTVMFKTVITRLDAAGLADKARVIRMHRSQISFESGRSRL